MIRVIRMEIARQFLVLLLCQSGVAATTHNSPTFYSDVLPILRLRCQECHRPGQIAPMPFLTYRQTRPWAKAIREAVLIKKMPPWFAEPGFGPFSNDRSLSKQEIETLVKWVESGAAEGHPAKDHRDAARAPRSREDDWNIARPDRVIQMPNAFPVPAQGSVDYQYIVVPTGLTEDKWVQMAELRTGSPAVVHHAVVYIREPGSKWLADAKPGIPYVPPGQTARERLLNGSTTSDILMVYAPGNIPENWAAGLAKFLKAGSDLVFQMHYTPIGHATSDQSRIGLVFARTRPSRRVITLQVGNDRFVIPPGDPDHRVEAWGTLPNDSTLLSFFPHMHLRGKSFEYNIIEADGHRRTLLKVQPYNFHWQLSYRLKQPLLLKASTKLECVAYYDNSRNNPANPDPEEAVRFGPQSWEEMMIGFFDVAIDAHIDKQAFFIRRP